MCQYVINWTRQQFTVGGTASSVDSIISDYNEFYIILSRRMVLQEGKN